MYVVAVTVFVKPEFVDLFIAASLDNARNMRKEPGNTRWDFCQAEDDPTRFLLYEAYHAKEDFAAHQQTEHQVVTSGESKMVIEWDIKFPKVVWEHKKTGPMSEARKQAIREGHMRRLGKLKPAGRLAVAGR